MRDPLAGVATVGDSLSNMLKTGHGPMNPLYIAADCLHPVNPLYTADGLHPNAEND
jgi:hypothetical protein